MKTTYYLEPLDVHTDGCIVGYLTDMASFKEPSDRMHEVDEATARFFDKSRETNPELNFRIHVNRHDENGIVPLQSFEPEEKLEEVPVSNVLVTAESTRGWTPFAANRRAEVAILRSTVPGVRFPVNPRQLPA